MGLCSLVTSQVGTSIQQTGSRAWLTLSLLLTVAALLATHQPQPLALTFTLHPTFCEATDCKCCTRAAWQSQHTTAEQRDCPVPLKAHQPLQLQPEGMGAGVCVRLLQARARRRHTCFPPANYSRASCLPWQQSCPSPPLFTVGFKK